MTATPDPFSKLVSDLEDYVAFETEEGRSAVEIDPTVIAELGTPPPLSASAAVSASDAPDKETAPMETAAWTHLDAVAASIADCTQCALHSGRTNTVPGEGNPQPEIMFVGEAPGADEDAQGRPFVGRAGKLLTKMIEAMGFQREEVFIANICKCRPPENRKPEPDEMEACIPYLKAQIALLKPQVIVCLGGTATEGLLGLTGITKVRGNWHTFEGIDVMPTFHPSYLLRKQSAKHEVWADLQAVLKHIGRPVPQQQG
jgi:DNA polymerase